MQHGRDHDERLAKAARPRAGNIPDDDEDTDLEAELLLAGRHAARPREGLVGADLRRAEHTRVGVGDAIGSNYAPTERATERERERHRLERERGHVAAGTEGNYRPRTDERRPGLLDDAAHKADKHVAGRPLPPRRG